MFDFGIVRVRPLPFRPEIVEVIFFESHTPNNSVRRWVHHYPDGRLGIHRLEGVRFIEPGQWRTDV